MTIDSYRISLLIIAFILTYFGSYLFAARIPQRLRKTEYQASRHYMGSAFLVLATSIYIFFFGDMPSMGHKYIAALNISCYYIASKLFAISFACLIGQRARFYLTNSKVGATLIYIFPYLVWATLLIKDPHTIQILQTIQSGILMASIILDITIFFRGHRAALEKSDYFYADGYKIHLNWMMRSVYFIIFAGVASAFFAMFSSLTPPWVCFSFMLYFIGVCIYIFNKLIHFMIFYGDFTLEPTLQPVLEQAPSETLETRITLSPQTIQHIKTNISKWMATKEYCREKTTIATAAKDMSTNRLYLSNYINTTYNCSFRVWISRLRITEAQRLFLENPEVTITDVASRVGFLSLAAFTHAFKNIVGMSPKQWLATMRSK